jgi:glycosyltransferase 2 family protein
MSTLFTKYKLYLRWLVSGLLLLILFRLVDFDALVPVLARIQPLPLVIALVLLILDRFFYGIRWQMILRPYAVNVPTSALIRITFVSTFLSNFLPSALSADVVRGYFLRKEAADMSTVISSVFLDRMMGFGTLLILAVGAATIGYAQGIFPTQWLVLLVILLGIGIAAVAVCLSPWFKTIITALQQSRFSLLQRSSKVIAVIRDYPWTFQRLLVIMGFSCFVYYLSIIACYQILRSIGAYVPMGHFFLFFLILQFAIIVPISVGGLGVHEGVWMFFLSSAGIAPEEALLFALLLRTVSLLVSLPGGLLVALYKPHIEPGKVDAVRGSGACMGYENS